MYQRTEKKEKPTKMEKVYNAMQKSKLRTEQRKKEAAQS